jgi:hypothetical protein
MPVQDLPNRGLALLKEADDEVKNKSIWSLTWGYSDELRESVPYDSLSKAFYFYPTEFNMSERTVSM